MRIKNFAVALSTISILLGCGTSKPPIDWSNSYETASRTKQSRDDFKKQTSFLGPNLPSGSSYVFLRAWKPDASPMFHQIYVHSWYPGQWRFYNSAFDSNGNSLETVLINRKVNSCGSMGCDYEEEVGLNVSRAYLEQAGAKGIRFKVSGKAGEEVFFVPAGYVAGFISVAK